MIKPPFLIIDDFLSPLMCEEIVDYCSRFHPNQDSNGRELVTSIKNSLYASRVANHLFDISEVIEEYFGTSTIKELSGIDFFIIPENGVPPPIVCENSKLIGKDWKRINDHDLTCIIFLKDYSEKDFDPEFEVYGGQVEFINHKLKFAPTRGTIIVYPSSENFLNKVHIPKACDSIMVKFHIICESRYAYKMNNFPGNVKTWFEI